MAQSSVIVFTGDGKGKTEAALGLALRALGADFKVAFIQFIKAWAVSEDQTLSALQQIYGSKIYLHKGGKGFYYAKDQAQVKPPLTEVSKAEHHKAAADTYADVLTRTQSGDYDLVIADEINNAVHDGLLTKSQLRTLIKTRHPSTHLCLTGRNFSKDLLPLVDYATSMTKLKHPYDQGSLAIIGIDY
ncbi:cob(I)yrinic acid a,c-diamide adenosyltransferase [Candidatus Saccharibacteria bacterium]|nr:cob(I)yrinic acid a,c-diamide adenosyltransferase [Candidatus Saccharibacteria bacterium]